MVIKSKIVYLMVFLFSMFLTEVSQAAIILLKSGQSVQGSILEETSQQVKLDVSGIVFTYYKEEVQSITLEEQDLMKVPVRKISYKVSKTFAFTSLVDLETLQFNYPLSHQNIPNQSVSNEIISPNPNAVTKDPDGNQIGTFYFSNLKAGEVHRVRVSFDVTLNEPQIKVDRTRVADMYQIFTRDMDIFLQVKDASSEEQQLAKKITQGLVNPYDKAKAIYDYVVSHFTYQNIQNFSGKQETFGTLVSQKGNCRDISRLFLVLSRLNGIPTKEVNGVAFQPKDSSEVCQTNAGHSWNEIYLPGYQWRPVDATFGLTEPKKFFLFPYEIHIPECYGEIVSTDKGSLYDGSSIRMSARSQISSDSVHNDLNIEIEHVKTEKLKGR
ncbi:MAG: transglutaminase domain-containing protein [Candidatus Omnitrophica bacterium]|nr:transglutaminase domain-containing protein [Candidatus Omnitrophota bacterium]